VTSRRKNTAELIRQRASLNGTHKSNTAPSMKKDLSSPVQGKI
jgi:hypothetical protein